MGACELSRRRPGDRRPADPSNKFSAARPEWYFLFLFQFLKFFHGRVGIMVNSSAR